MIIVVVIKREKTYPFEQSTIIKIKIIMLLYYDDDKVGKVAANFPLKEGGNDNGNYQRENRS